MPYRIESRGDEWCVIKESDGKSMGCHASRSRAVAQQRALYANEAQTASAEGNGSTRVEIVAPADSLAPALVASIEAISERLITTEETLAEVVQTLAQVAEIYKQDREQLLNTLTAAVNAPAPEAPVVHVNVPEQPAPVVNVPAQPRPDVHVTVEAQPVREKTVKFERSLDGRITGATVEEVEQWPTT